MAVWRAVLVGAGGMGQAWARNVKAHAAQVELVGWVDIRERAAEAAAAALELSVTYTGTDLEKALQELRPDFVIDVTVPEAHEEVTLLALAHGIPVLGEKPLAHSMEAARAMVRASEKAGKLYMVSQSRRYDNRLHAYRRLIEKTCGPLGILNADFYIGAHFGGFRDQMDHVLLLDMAIHSFDQARFLSGADPIAVYAEEFNPAWSWYEGPASASCLFELTQGLRFTYRGSWCAEGHPTSWECDWRAVGATGTALWDGHGALRGARVVGREGFHRETEPQEEPVLAEVSSGIAGSLEEFLYALETGATPMGECHDNLKSLAMVFSAIESASTGKKVQIDTRL